VLKAIGCDIIQGYYFSKPVPALEIPKIANTEFLKSEVDHQTVASLEHMNVL
jgi:EAL domain-containing protein (putative c-di-GMP-specific phosphodiesterase class I)